MRTFLLTLLLASFLNLPFSKSQCTGFSSTTTLVTQGCLGNCGMIAATPVNGTAPYNYQLYYNGNHLVGATNNTEQICISGIYYYEITDANNCISQTNQLNYNQATTPLSIVGISELTDYNGFPVSCIGNTDACIKVNAIDGFPGPNNINYTYDIGGGPQGNDTICNLGIGTYTVTVTDFVGCETSMAINLTAPSITIVAPSSICENTTTTVSCQITGNQSPYTYLWDDGETSSIVSRSAGSISVTVTDVNGCATIATDTIIAIPLLDSLVISQSVNPFGLGHCENGDSVILDVTAVSGTLITSGVFYGAGVRNGIGGPGVATFYPDSAVIDMGHVGNSEISYIYQTTTGCWDTTSLTVSIHSLPELSLINLPDSLCPNTDSFQLIALNTAQFGSMGQFTLMDSLINKGNYMVRDANGIIISNFIGLFDTLSPMDAIGHQQINISYTYTSPSSFGLCSNTIQDSIMITDCCVWPGDTDNDGIANNFDLLPIGLHYGSTGLNRTSQTIDYTCHASDNWNATILGLSLVDQKHADCDGNGLINAIDTNAILLNWSQTHLKNASTTSASTTMYIDTAVTNPGDTIIVDVILNQTLIPSNNYGLAFTINYDPLLVDTNSVYLTFDNSWLGLINVDMIGIQKDFYAQGEVEVGLTRIDQTSVIGSGPIAQMHFIIKDDVLPKTLNKRLDLSIDNIRLINHLGVETSVTGLTSQVLITEPVLGFDASPLNSAINEIYIAPNPVKESVYIYSSVETIQEINLYNITGQLILNISTVRDYNKTLDLGALSLGVYLLEVKTENSSEILRLVKE